MYGSSSHILTGRDASHTLTARDVLQDITESDEDDEDEDNNEDTDDEEPSFDPLHIQAILSKGRGIQQYRYTILKDVFTLVYNFLYM